MRNHLSFFLGDENLKVFMIRHGESEANILNVFSNTGYKHGLTERGKEQARELAGIILEKGIHPDYVFSSPLKRAVETTEIICDTINRPFAITNALIEFDVGDFEGRSDRYCWEAFKQLWDEWFLNNNRVYSIGGGENLINVVNRIKAFLLNLQEKYPDDITVLLISHGGTIKSVISAIVNNLTRKDLRDVWLAYSDYVEIDLKLFGESECIRFGDFYK
jgi:broad specificity phosphatase PhoE